MEQQLSTVKACIAFFKIIQALQYLLESEAIKKFTQVEE